jgi:hypothetical protein
VIVADLPSADQRAHVVVVDRHGCAWDVERAETSAAGTVVQLHCPGVDSYDRHPDYEYECGCDPTPVEDFEDDELIAEMESRGYVVGRALEQRAARPGPRARVPVDVKPL